MKTTKLRANIALDEDCYFLVKWQDQTYTLTLTDSLGNPIHFTGITRKQLRNLINQAQKATYCQDEELVQKLYTVAEAAK